MRLAALVLLFSGLLLTACKPSAPTSQAVQPAIVEQVQVTAAAQAASYTGKIHARHETVLSFRVAGKVAERMVGMGDQVKAGQMLARLDASDLKLEAKAAKAKLEAAREQFELAQSRYQRAASLLKRNATSQSVYDQRKAKLEVARAELEQAQKQYAVHKNRLGYTKLRADHAGVITGVPVEAGQVVSAGQPVFELARSGERELRLVLPARRIDTVARGDTVKITFWSLPDVRVTGRVRKVAAAADPRTGTYEVRITLLDQPDGLHLGMSATAHFKRQASEQVIRLPLTSLYHANNEPAVWVVDKQTDKVSLQPVTIRRYKDNVVVLAAGQGLQPGEWVVTKGVGKLHAGQRVDPVDQFFSKEPVAKGRN